MGVGVVPAAPGDRAAPGGRVRRQGLRHDLLHDADPLDPAALPLRPGDAPRLARPVPALDREHRAHRLSPPALGRSMITRGSQTTSVEAGERSRLASPSGHPRSKPETLLAPTAGPEPPAELQDRKETESGERSRLVSRSGHPRPQPETL